MYRKLMETKIDCEAQHFFHDIILKWKCWKKHILTLNLPLAAKIKILI